ncbi:T9SS type A sorting domain-containing protein, partial [bacterium]|nr:T9SS type A sorting domain-containing protein [bacterium]
LLISLPTTLYAFVFDEHTIETNITPLQFTRIADLDGDMDGDFLVCSPQGFYWLENLDGSGGTWEEHTIFDDAFAAFTASVDMDQDSDADAVTWYNDNGDLSLSWYENADGAGGVWTEHVIQSGGSEIEDLLDMLPVDLDNDGDVDVAAMRGDHDYHNPAGEFGWWEDTGAGWTYHTIAGGDGSYDSPTVFAVADLNGDGFPDLQGGSLGGDRIAWFENPGTSGGDWTEHLLVTDVGVSYSGMPGDIDGDDDIDLLLSYAGNRAVLVWMENVQGDGSQWQSHQIAYGSSGELRYGQLVDLDGDSALDILVAYTSLGLQWWCNDSGDGTQWTRHDIARDLDHCYSMQAADLDGDGDPDLSIPQRYEGEISWWEQVEEPGPPQISVSPDTISWHWYEPHDPPFTTITLRNHGTSLAEWNLEVHEEWLEADSESGSLQIGAETEVQIRAVSFPEPGLHQVNLTLHTENGDPEHQEIALFLDAVAYDETFTPFVVSESYEEPSLVAAGDVDGDSHSDFFTASSETGDISWWENEDGLGETWTQHNITETFTGVIDMYGTDPDNDGDMDIVAASEELGEIVWWDNANGDGTTWTPHTISDDVPGILSIDVEDIDGDGTLDLVGLANTAGDVREVSWWKNEEGTGMQWSRHFVFEVEMFSVDVDAADIDGDGDCDILCTRQWCENLDGTGQSWEQHTVTTHDYYLLEEAKVADIDADGCADVVFTGDNRDSMWFEGFGYCRHRECVGDDWYFVPIHQRADPVNSIHMVDMDGDGYTDVLTTSISVVQPIRLYLNFGDYQWGIYLVDTSLRGASDVTATDLDGDGDPDVIAVSENDDVIGVWKTTGYLGVEDKPASDVEMPDRFQLSAAYPNPFNATTTISVTLPRAGELEAAVYNINGQQVASLANGLHHAGEHRFHFDATGLASGVYFVRAAVPGQQQVRKIVLLR